MPSYASPGNGSVYVQSSAPASGDGVFVDTDTNLVYALVSGTATIVASAAQTGIKVYPHSTTIGDYTTPAAQVASSESGPTFSDTFASDNWTDVGTGLGVASGVMRSTGAEAAECQSYRALGVTLSDTLWFCNFDVIMNNVTGADNDDILIFGFTAGTSHMSASQDMLGIQMAAPDTFRPCYKDGAGGITTGDAVNFAVSTQYYARLERTTATNLRLSIFTDSGRTTHATGSPVNLTIPSTVASLTTAHFSGFDNTSAGKVDMDIDNVVVQNNASSVESPTTPASNAIDNDTGTNWQSDSEANPNIYVDVGANSNLSAVALYKTSADTTTQVVIQTSTNATDWTTRRTITSTDITAGAYTYWRFNLAIGRYVRIRSNTGTNIMGYAEIKVLEPTDQQIGVNGYFLSISSSDTSLDGDAE